MLRGPLSFSRTVALSALLLFPGLLSSVPCFAAETGKQAPDFGLADVTGSLHRLSDSRGKVVVLNFWATWCPECLSEIDSLSAFTEKYRNRDVVVLTVSVDKNEAALTDFLKGHPVKFPVLIDREGDVFVRKYTIRGLPATLLIDRTGAIAERMLGAEDFLSAEFTKRIEGLLGK